LYFTLKFFVETLVLVFLLNSLLISYHHHFAERHHVVLDLLWMEQVPGLAPAKGRRCPDTPHILFGVTAPRVSSLTWFLDYTQRRTTVGRTPLDE
jgi:hypothetical protein